VIDVLGSSQDRCAHRWIPPPTKHGEVSATTTNGSSGQKVRRLYLDPLGLQPNQVTFTDVYPVFMVKGSTSGSGGGPRQQGDAIREEYDPIASALGFPASSLPPRLSKAQLPRRAAEDFGEQLVQDLAATAAPLVITLGEEPWQTLALLDAVHLEPPADRIVDLYGAAYGQRGRLRIGGYEAEWLPLVHPGLLRSDTGTPPPDGSTSHTTAGWNALHHHWTRTASAS
jgi:hypothetical protein